MHPSRQTNYLLYGPRGTGKTSTARIYAKALNCENLQDGNPCNACTSCLLIQNNATVDFIEIDAASHTGVDNVLRKKVYIIDEVHMLSKGAFNALLKTMEEPKPYLCFILATTELNRVPETIVSRCHVFNFKKIPDDLMIARLSYIADQENIQTEIA
jgi:DNA polymerase-3 subunit gamma/tau